jgi:diguanylate cyclase (GGDEF)-like protein
MKMHCIPNPQLTHFLKREARAQNPSTDLDLSRIFCEILNRANDFVPSEAGSIFLDDPLVDRNRPDRRDLVLIACFGEMSGKLVGMRLPATRGIVGEVYRSGKPYCSSSPEKDPLFRGGPGRIIGFKTRSVVCAPLQVEGKTIGVIELLNHRLGKGYAESDLELLGIFAQTISASIVNAMDAQRSREMAKRDDLTGLYNDRYLHHTLAAVIGDALRTGEECGLIFLDLDHFKSINDNHGHLVGSRVLHEVGVMLRQILPGEAIPARYGGDEFVIVVPGAGRQELYWVAETVRKNIESKVFLEYPDPADVVNYPALRIRGVITCSVGIATLWSDVVPELGTGPFDPIASKNELMRKADKSMYRAKEAGRNQIVTCWSWSEESFEAY